MEGAVGRVIAYMFLEKACGLELIKTHHFHHSRNLLRR